MNRRYRVYLCWGINRQTTIKESGNKVYVKIEAPITPLLSSIRSLQIHNEKGKGRPPCTETNVKLPNRKGRGRLAKVRAWLITTALRTVQVRFPLFHDN